MKPYLLTLLLLPAIFALPASAQNSSVPANVSAEVPAGTPQPAIPQPAAPAAGSTATEDDGDQPQVIVDSAAALLKLFVLSAILESALALFFNWRPIVLMFNRKGLKPLVSLIVAAALTIGFRSHLFATLFASYGYDTGGESALLMCRLLEAAVLAGGSSGVNRLLRNLGIRPIDPAAEQNPTPRPQEAWIAVGHRRVHAVGLVQVEIAEGADPAAAQWQIAGQVSGTPPVGWLPRWLLRDPTRFPQSGGYTLLPGTSYMVRLTGTDAAGQPIASPVWGPNAFADRAVVDLEIAL